jgi:choline-sulfatase
MTEKPWVLFVSMICPHFPIIAPQKFYDMYPFDSLPPFKPADEELFRNHPWWRGFNDCFIYERFIKDDDHRKKILASYLGSCSFMDDNVGTILKTLERSGLSGDTRVIYLSDHGDNIGARRIWGKSTMHDESTGIPIIMAGAGIPENKVCSTPVSMVDMFPTILQGAGVPTATDDRDLPGKSLLAIASEPDDVERIAFSEYHAAGAISGVYMIRTYRYKYVHYAGGYDPELYDFELDPEELNNVAGKPDYADTLSNLRDLLLDVVDPEAVNARALADQAHLIAQHGGREAVIARGAANNTPVPGDEPEIVR